jgi:glycosyltransferase involved in cell wall biosynthesis
MKNYIVITPAYNEEDNIELTIKSFLKQTILPLQWIIVNDGSTDNTGSIINSYAEKYQWITLLDRENGKWPFGTHAVKNFEIGLKAIKHTNYDFLVKFDADIDIDREDYFEFQLNQFKKNIKLGISSGITYYIDNLNNKKIVWHPVWRTTGAMKMYRRECYENMGGLVPIYGWDGIDDLKARFNGWETTTFYELEVNHLEKKRDFKRKLDPKFFLKQGKSFYVRGYPLFFILLKSLMFCVKIKPKQAFYFLKGYINSHFNNVEQCVSESEKKFIRKFILKRALGLIK